MTRRCFWFPLLLSMGLAAAASGGAVAPDLAVHEWGTFLAMQGSDGVTLDGMYHEEHALPAFVHARSRDQLRMPSVIVKGETPVIYFYTSRAQSVRVEVGFPRGIWTQWYPQASRVGPQFEASGSPADPQDGHIHWNAEILPGEKAASLIPPTPKDSLWRYAREVDAAYVRTRDTTGTGTRDEYERFLFYRGLGRAPLPLRMTAEGNGTLSIDPGEQHGARHLFVLRVEGGRGAYRYLPELQPGKSVASVLPSMTGALPREEFQRRLGDDLAGRLVEAGLFPREARAMVNTWRESYFGTEGVRVLFVLPQAWTDAYIPMRLDPQPREVVRVMVGRLEALTPQREQRAEQALRDLGSQDTRKREAAFQFLRAQGRYVEPVIRRVMRSTEDSRARSLCRRLLSTGFVTELRAAVQDASSGKGRSGAARKEETRLYLRAQLAALLREAGMDEEAQAEAAPVLEALRRMPEPPLEKSGTRHYLRARARALEGAGDAQGAALAYARFVKFGSQVKRCGGCHDQEGPKTMAWFRGWWVGRKYAEYAEKAGLADQALREQQEALARNPGDVNAQMLLAYLYEARGEKARSEALWAQIAPAPGPRTASAR